MAGLGGAFLSLAYTPMWVEDMTAGARLDRAGAGGVRLLAAAGALLAGAYLFGGVTILQLYVQGWRDRRAGRSSCRCCPISPPSWC